MKIFPIQSIYIYIYIHIDLSNRPPSNEQNHMHCINEISMMNLILFLIIMNISKHIEALSS